MTRAPRPPRPGVLFKRAEDCPDAAQHTPHPATYLGHANWADEMRKQHRQRQCPTCGFWAVWERKT